MSMRNRCLKPNTTVFGKVREFLVDLRASVVESHRCLVILPTSAAAVDLGSVPLNLHLCLRSLEYRFVVEYVHYSVLW